MNNRESFVDNVIVLIRSAVLLVALVCSGEVSAAGPVEELYGDHLTLMADFDDGTADSPRANALKSRVNTYLVGEGGLFGSKGLLGGSFNFNNPKGRNGRPIGDFTRPGTVMFWIKLAVDIDPELKYDPAATHFSAMWSSTKRFLVFRQDGKSMGASGAAPLSAYFHTRTKGGKNYASRSDAGPSYRKWKKGEWHLVAATWRPDGVGISYDGAPFKNVVSTEPLGPGVWLLNFQNYWGKDKTAGSCVMDDCAILDFALSDGQVKELWNEYQARMKETPGAQQDVQVTLEKCGAKDASHYEIVLRAKNLGKKKVALRYAAKARPRDSQPAAANDSFSLAPGAEKTLRLVGPALGEEPVTADFGVISEDKKTVYFRRQRVFAPHAGEPEWMRAPSAVSFKFAYYPYANAIHASADITGCDDFAKLGSLKLAVFKKGSNRPVAEKSFRPDPSGVTEFFWRGLPELDGEYVCRLSGVGIDEVKAEQAFERRHFEWEHNRIGLSDTVPEPFKKVKVEGIRNEELRIRNGGLEIRNGGKVGTNNGGATVPVAHYEKVSVVLREHVVDKETGLWQQVTAAGKEIFARPMALVELKSKVEVEELRSKEVKTLSSTLTPTPTSTPTPNFDFSNNWDVDGFCDWRLTLKPGHHEPMALEIPVKGEVAWLYHACGDGLRSNPGGRIPAGKGQVWNSTKAPHNGIVGDYVPYVWIGGTLRGISVFGDNDRGWVIEKEPCQEIIREADGTVVLRLNLVQRAVDLKEARTIRIGFMATPVKPMPENWRAKEHGALLGSCWCWGTETPCCSIEPYDGTDGFFRKMAEARRTGKYDEDYLKRMVDEFPYRSKPGTEQYKQDRQTMLNHFRNGFYNAKGAGDKGRLTFYTNGRGVHYGDPKGQGRTFCNEWNRFEYFTRNIVRTTERAYDLDPVESYRDYAAWWYAKMVETGACDHMYWDDVYLSGNSNLFQTDAYRMPNGQIQPATGVYNMRALVRRCAVLMAERGRDPTGNWVHMTNTAIAPICSFAGVNYDWEDLSGEQPHQVKYPKDYILACTIGRQFGNRVGIMGYFSHSLDRKSEKGKWLDRTGTGVMLTHELRWNRWSGHESYYKYHDLLCAWGYRTPEVDVWNYWDEDVKYPLAVTGVENASIVMAKKTVGEAYVCVSSFSAADGSVTVTPDAAAIGLKPGWKATDAESGAAIPVENGSFRLDIPQYNWRLVKLER